MENTAFHVLDGGLATELVRAGFDIDVSPLLSIDQLH